MRPIRVRTTAAKIGGSQNNGRCNWPAPGKRVRILRENRGIQVCLRGAASRHRREEVICQTDFISDHGSPLMVSFAALGTVVSRTDVLPPGGSVHQETNVDLNASLAPGWARATCSGPVKASLLYRLHNSEGAPTAEAGVNATAVPATRFGTFAEQGEGQFGTGNHPRRPRCRTGHQCVRGCPP